MSDPMTRDPLERELGDIMSPHDAPLPTLSPVERRAHIDAALLAASDADSAPSYRPRMIALAAAAILLLALGVGALMSRSSEPEAIAPAATHQPEREVANRGSDSPARAHVEDRGDVFAPFGEGVSHGVDDTSSRLSVDSTRAVLAPGARARLLSRSERDLVIALDRGEATFEVDPSRSQRVRVRTEFGVVEVTGTVFTVSLDEEAMRVSVERGEVAVRAKGQPPARVRAGESLASERAERPAEIASHTPPRDATREDAPRKKEPLADKPKEALTSEALLARALGARASGDWQAALDAYEEILAKHPRSDAARAAAISVARISLDHADRPGRALAAMERFLASRPKDDALRPLAHQARIEALEALGKSDRVREAREEMKAEQK